MRALSTASSSASGAGPEDGALGRQRGHDLEVDLLVVERHHLAALGERPQVGLDEGDPTMTSAATAQAASSGRSASTARERPSALAASPAMRASWPAPTNPTRSVFSWLAPVAGFA